MPKVLFLGFGPVVSWTTHSSTLETKQLVSSTIHVDLFSVHHVEQLLDVLRSQQKEVLRRWNFPWVQIFATASPSLTQLPAPGVYYIFWEALAHLPLRELLCFTWVCSAVPAHRLSPTALLHAVPSVMIIHTARGCLKSWLISKCRCSNLSTTVKRVPQKDWWLNSAGTLQRCWNYKLFGWKMLDRDSELTKVHPQWRAASLTSTLPAQSHHHQRVSVPSSSSSL